MSYDPIRIEDSLFGYVRATAKTVTSLNNVVFDLPSDAGPYVSSGDTVLPSTCLTVMRLGRDDDASGEARFFYATAPSTTTPERNGSLEVITTKYWHGGNEAQGYQSTVNPYNRYTESPGNAIINDWSHFMYWRL